MSFTALAIANIILLAAITVAILLGYYTGSDY